MSDPRPSLADRFFRDSDGQLVLAQLPNLPLIAWGVFRLAASAVGEGQARTGCERLSTAFLLIWAYLEITEGVNWFRRMLGTVVFAVVSIGLFA